MYYLYNWMKGLKDTRKLVDLCLPGSHDAGVYTDEEKGVKPGDTARCQQKNIYEQAMVGSRVFDIRCFLRSTGFLGKTKIPTMGHFFADKAPLGDWGGTLESALDDAVRFIAPPPLALPSEFLIFRIGHTECTAEVAEVLEKTDTTTGKLKYKNFILWGDRGNLANLEVKHLRGKLLLIFDEKFLGSGDFKTADGYYPYVKYPMISQNGLSFCGMYSGELKARAKPSKKDQGNWSAEGAVEIAMNASKEHKDLQTHPPDHLFWVYWQETGGNVLQNTTATTGVKYRLDNFLHELRDPNNNFRLPNVIGHDFVNKATCSRIVKINSDLANALETYAY
jgi:hypothetical protein